MTDPIAFTATSPRFALPMLFAGQAQKEFHVNEAHALVDMLLHPAVEGEAGEPPAAPAEGESWLIAPAATGEWAGRDTHIAGFQTGTWIFAAPRDGLRVYDKVREQLLFYRNGWQAAQAPIAPQGGEIVDTEARNAIRGLIASLAGAGIVPPDAGNI